MNVLTIGGQITSKKIFLLVPATTSANGRAFFLEHRKSWQELLLQWPSRLRGDKESTVKSSRKGTAPENALRPLLRGCGNHHYGSKASDKSPIHQYQSSALGVYEGSWQYQACRHRQGQMAFFASFANS